MNLQEALQSPEVREFLRSAIQEAVAEEYGPSELEPLELSEVVAEGGSFSARDLVEAQHALAVRVGVAAPEERQGGVDLREFQRSREKRAKANASHRPAAHAASARSRQLVETIAPTDTGVQSRPEPAWAARMRQKGISADVIAGLGWSR